MFFFFNIPCGCFLNFGNQQAHEKRPRESILRAEFANAIDFINKDLSEENRLMFLHWDLHKESRRYISNMLSSCPFVLSNNAISFFLFFVI